jgi:hypothetical protein
VYGQTSWADAVVEDVIPHGELPEIGGAPAVALVNEALAEADITATALLSFDDAGETKIFAAVLRRGVWFDLKGRRLTIVDRNQAA